MTPTCKNKQGRALIVCALLAFSWTAHCIAEPAIQFTYVPLWGSFQNLTGRVDNVAVGDYRVAVLIFLPNLGWYTKPTWPVP